MGSGSSKNKGPSPPKHPPSSETPILKENLPREDPKTEAKPSSSPKPPTPKEAAPKEDPKQVTKPTSPPPSAKESSEKSESSSTKQEASTISHSNTPPQTTSESESVSKQKQGAGDSTVVSVPSPPAKEDQQSSREPEGQQQASDDRETQKKESVIPAAAKDTEPQKPEVTDNKPSAMTEPKPEERVVLEASEQQRRLDTSLRATNALVKQDGLLPAVSKGVTKLSLKRALPPNISLRPLVAKMDNLQVLDVSENQMGPQAVRLLCLALSPACPLVSLSLAGNKTDTDTADSVGRLLTSGPPLEYLDVSSNNLGKDFFSRCAGQALKTNTSLTTLRAQSIGMVDARALLEGLQENSTLVELDLSNNQITDGQALGAGLATVLKKSGCALQSLALQGCNMNGQGLTMLTEGLTANTSLMALNLNNNEFGSLQTLMSLVVAAFRHPALTNLHLNDARVTDSSLSDIAAQGSQGGASSLEVVSVGGSHLTDNFWSKLATAFPGTLTRLVDVDISNNQVTAATLQHLWQLSKDGSGKSSIMKLTTAMNDMNGLPAQLTRARFPRLAYLNTRRVRFSPDAFQALADLPGGLPLTTLVLDGIKLSGKQGLTTLLGNLKSNGLTALSLSGCSLNDADLTALAEVMGSGVNLHMLKLSANRLTDGAVTGLVEAMLRSRSHPLGVLDLAENQITDEGAKALCRLYTTKSHSSSLHSLNLATNTIGKEGILCLLGCVGGKSALKCLYINNQEASFLEMDVEEMYIKVASVLGYTVKRSDEKIETGVSELPSLPDGLTINLRGLGGHAGELGPVLDCPAILTHASCQRSMTLTLEHALDLCASLQGQKSDAPCSVTKEDWTRITGADKDNSIPSWLQLDDSRCKGVYLSNLPGNSTSQRLEALFETEADCNIDEVFLVKDPVTKNNAGTAWVLFSDQGSVDRAMDLYHSGQALIFGTPFTVSRLRVNVEDSMSSEESEKARRDLAERRKERAAEDRAHRQLILQNTEESWKRHAYRLAHPAYADGRIW